MEEEEVEEVVEEEEDEEGIAAYANMCLHASNKQTWL